MPGIAGSAGGRLVVYQEQQEQQQVAVHRVQHGLHGPLRPSIAWGNGNQLRLTYLSQSGGAVVQLDLGQAGLDPASRAEKRRIAHGSAPAFALLQSQRHAQLQSDGPYRRMPVAWWENVLEYSRSISAILAPPFSKADRPAKDVLDSVVVKAVWDFVEIVSVDQSCATWLSERLVEWLRSYDRIFSETRVTLHKKLVTLQLRLSSLQFPEEDEDYWNGLASALAVGWLDIVVNLLHVHGSYQHDQIDDRKTENGLVEAVAVLVSQMPRLCPSLPQAAPGVAYTFKPEFFKAWERWRSQVAMLDISAYWGDCNNRATLNGLKRLLQILLGNVEVLVASTSHWMELLVAHVLHVRPSSVTLEGLLGLTTKCIHYKPEPEKEPLRELLLAIIGDDTEVILAECALLFDPWMTAHIIELLTAQSSRAQTVLREERYALGDISLEENCRLHYAQVLSSHQLTWQLAPVYLASCPRQGMGMLEGLLLKQPLAKDHRLALKALEICRLYNLEDIATIISRIVGVHNWKHGRKGTGITWLQRARDDIRLSAIANQLLQSVAVNDSSTSENLQQLDSLVDLLGSEAHHVGGLLFLHRYRDLKQVLQFIRESRPKDGDTQKLTAAGRQAAECLFQLLKPGVTPQRFWASILQDAVELLEWPEQVLLNAAETFMLLNRMEELALAKMRGDVDVSDDRSNHILDRVRLALASNLGRAFLLE